MMSKTGKVEGPFWHAQDSGELTGPPRRIKVTCRCKNQFVTDVPEQVFEEGSAFVLICDKCGQLYVLFEDAIQRFENFDWAGGKPVDLDVTAMVGRTLPKEKQKRVVKRAEA